MLQTEEKNQSLSFGPIKINLKVRTLYIRNLLATILPSQISTSPQKNSHAKITAFTRPVFCQAFSSSRRIQILSSREAIIERFTGGSPVPKINRINVMIIIPKTVEILKAIGDPTTARVQRHRLPVAVNVRRDGHTGRELTGHGVSCPLGPC